MYSYLYKQEMEMSLKLPEHFDLYVLRDSRVVMSIINTVEDKLFTF